MTGSGREAWQALCAIAVGGALLAPWIGADRLDWQPALAWREPWRWWTAAWVHWSGLHLAANLVGAALVSMLGTVAGCGWRATAAWGLAWPLTQLGLLAAPSLVHYGGLSGVLHAAVAVVGLQLVWVEQAVRRGIGAALLVGLMLKVLLETPWLGPLHRVSGWDIPIVPLAHATGVLAGLVCAVLLMRKGFGPQ